MLYMLRICKQTLPDKLFGGFLLDIIYAKPLLGTFKTTLSKYIITLASIMECVSSIKLFDTSITLVIECNC